MRVHIVCPEITSTWILGKIFTKLADALREFNVDSSMSCQPDFDADVNHRIYYLPFEGKKTKLDTILVTHIDNNAKREFLVNQLGIADGAIFFSQQTKNLLSTVGAPLHKLVVINPPQDEAIKPRKLKVGFLTNFYPKYRKREDLIYELISTVNLSAFRFEIMGEGWEQLTKLLDQYNVEYALFSEFDYDQYMKLVPQLDYFLYTGMDEGSMAFLDALAADVKTIVTQQGFHLDASVPIDYPFETAHELKEIFQQIAQSRSIRPNAVAMWTWTNYAASHLAYWRSLLNRKT